ncbi:unnamed protein product [Malus baccata var. baccata]
MTASSYLYFLILFWSPVTFATPSLAKTSFKLKALILLVSKDPATLIYLTSIKQRTSPASVRLILDLGGDFVWVDCEKDYGQLGQGHLSLHSTDCTHPGKLVSVPNFLFICSQTYLLENLPTGIEGFAGLGRDKIGIPSQFASTFRFSKKFALCLPSSTRSNGAVFFGVGPYVLHPVTYLHPIALQPFHDNPLYVEGKPSAEYFINVTSIKMNSLTLPLNTSSLVFDRYGYEGTKISIVNPYMVLKSSIFNTLNWAFLKVLPAFIPRLGFIESFEQCFNLSHIGENDVPIIDFVLQSESVYWRLSRANSLVQVKKDMILSNPRTSIVIGGHQLKDNLLQFYLAKKKLRFNSSLLSHKTNCSNFNFSSTTY